MTQKHYLGTFLSLNPPPGHHYHENALVGDPRAPRNTSFMKNLSFFFFPTFREDFNIFSKNCLRIHKRPRKLHHRSGSFVHFLGQMLNWKTKKIK